MPFQVGILAHVVKFLFFRLAQTLRNPIGLLFCALRNSFAQGVKKLRQVVGAGLFNVFMRQPSVESTVRYAAWECIDGS